MTDQKRKIKEDWHRADIIAAVRKTKTNLQQLSRRFGLGRTTLSNALYSPCPKYERLIAEQIGTVPQVIWPSRYNADGTPKSGRGERGLELIILFLGQTSPASSSLMYCDRLNIRPKAPKSLFPSRRVKSISCKTIVNSTRMS